MWRGPIDAKSSGGGPIAATTRPGQAGSPRKDDGVPGGPRSPNEQIPRDPMRSTKGGGSRVEAGLEDRGVRVCEKRSTGEVKAEGSASTMRVFRCSVWGRLAFQDSVHNLGRRASFRPRRARCAAVAIRHFGRLRRPYPTEPMGQIVGSGRRGRTIPRHPNHLGRILDGRHLRRTRPARFFVGGPSSR